MKKMLNAMFVAVLMTGGVAACGSDDDDKKDTPATAVTTAEGSDATTGDAEGSENADVAAYCTQADEFAAAWEKFMADPSSGDANALTQEGQTLVARAAELTTANPDDAEAIAACNQRIADAMQS